MKYLPLLLPFLLLAAFAAPAQATETEFQSLLLSRQPSALETLAIIAYRQPITRAEIEEVRGVVVSTNIVRTLLERNWVRVVGHRDVPGKPAMFGTTKDFLDYFGLKKLEELPTLAELKDGLPELSPQSDLVDTLEAELEANEAGAEAVPIADSADDAPAVLVPAPANDATAGGADDSDVLAFNDEDSDEDEGSELEGPDLIDTEAAAREA